VVAHRQGRDLRARLLVVALLEPRDLLARPQTRDRRARDHRALDRAGRAGQHDQLLARARRGRERRLGVDQARRQEQLGRPIDRLPARLRQRDHSIGQRAARGQPVVGRAQPPRQPRERSIVDRSTCANDP
jgi:hypothetical protein